MKLRFEALCGVLQQPDIIRPGNPVIPEFSFIRILGAEVVSVEEFDELVDRLVRAPPCIET